MPRTHDQSSSASHDDHDDAHAHVHAAAEHDSRGRFWVVGIAAALLVVGFLFNEQLHRTPWHWAEFAVLLGAYLLVGAPVVIAAARDLARGRVFDEHFLMTVSTAGAIAIHQLPEAAAVMVFYAVGEHLQEEAVGRSRRAIAALVDSRPPYANLVIDGEVRRVRPEDVAVGQLILVRPGERVPLDGVVVEGASFVDASALTGEPVPRRVVEGSGVLAGMVNGKGALTVRALKISAESAAARMLDLVESAGARKAPTERFISAFCRYYTPAVVAGAVGLAVLPPLLLPGATFAVWFYRALVLLVISCPCALMISVPLGYFGGVGAASRCGILVKGASYLDALTRLHTVVFDKTGTLTRGVFAVAAVVPRNGFGADEVLAWAAAAEVYSIHPIAQSIRGAYGRAVAPERVSDYRETPALGVTARVDGRLVLAGNDRLLHHEGIAHDAGDCGVAGTVVYVALDGRFAGYIVIGDEVKPDAAAAVARLKRLGVRRTVLLTGDQDDVARRVAVALGIDAHYAGLLPAAKVDKVEELLEALPDRRRHKLAFVGDGVNDAPVIARADVGVAMGALGSDAAIEAADVVLMEDSPMRLCTAVEVARRTALIVRENVVLALGVKVFFLALGAVGVATIWEAVFADVGVALLAVLNAARTSRFRPRPRPWQ